MNVPIEPNRVTLAIEGWNADDLESRRLFERSLRSLAAQSYPVDECQVLILLDQGQAQSDTGWMTAILPTAEIVAVPGATYFRLKNSALRNGTREFIVFADSDVAYAPSWLEHMLHCLREHPGIIAGNTRFDPGFLSRTLDLCDWSAARPGSGRTDWFYGNNVAAPRELLLRYGFREDLGRSGGGAVNLFREQLHRDGVGIWFCAEARGSHDLAPFWPKRIRIGAYQIRFRRRAPDSSWARLSRVPILAPFLVTLGTMVKAWQRAFRLRSTLPLRGWSLPFYWISIAGVKAVECLGAVGYAWFPAWFDKRYEWFSVPSIGGEAMHGEGRRFDPTP